MHVPALGKSPTVESVVWPIEGQPPPVTVLRGEERIGCSPQRANEERRHHESFVLPTKGGRTAGVVRSRADRPVSASAGRRCAEWVDQFRHSAELGAT